MTIFMRDSFDSIGIGFLKDSFCAALFGPYLNVVVGMVEVAICFNDCFSSFFGEGVTYSMDISGVASLDFLNFIRTVVCLSMSANRDLNVLGILPRLTDVVGSIELILLAAVVVITVAAVVAAVVAAGVALDVVVEAAGVAASVEATVGAAVTTVVLTVVVLAFVVVSGAAVVIFAVVGLAAVVVIAAAVGVVGTVVVLFTTVVSFCVVGAAVEVL